MVSVNTETTFFTLEGPSILLHGLALAKRVELSHHSFRNIEVLGVEVKSGRWNPEGIVLQGDLKGDVL